MIYSLRSSDDRFKTLEFGPGLSILVAEQHSEASETDTRNGVGKSSFVALIHFLLGGNVGKDSIFTSTPLVGDTFTLELDVGKLRRSVSRSGADPGAIFLSPDPNESPVQGELLEIEPALLQLRPTDWQAVLREQWFGLVGDGGPSARSLLSYFARRADAGGFQSAFKQNYQQAPGDFQVAVSYLLDLDWGLAESWEDVRKRDKNVKALASALKEGRLGSFVVGTVAKLRTEVTVAENRVAELRQRIDEFRVVEAFEDLQDEANRISSEIRRLTDENGIDKALVEQLRLSYDVEVPPSAEALTDMYAAAGVQLGNLVQRRFEEVAEFHSSIVENRVRHLREEVDRAQARIERRAGERRQLDQRRGEILTILRSGGALSELSALQGEQTRAQARLEELRSSFRIADEIASGRAGVRQARQSLLVDLQSDQREREAQLQKLIGRFEEFSAQLYDERVGSLEIGSSENGPTFDISIDAGKSRGINSMQVFCFDLLFAEVCSQRSVGPGFLIHDSHLFDGVDERQIGRALALADEISTLNGFQYIATINSDDLPTTLPDGFDLDEHLMDVRLTDTVDSGGLFGFRF